MRAPCSFAHAAIALILLGMAAPVHAGSVLLTNLDQSVRSPTSGVFVGQSFIAGTVDEPLYGAQIRLDTTNPPTSGITLEVEARNANGTVGATLFSNFSSSFDSTTGLVTFTANSSFELIASTGYWLVLSDRLARGVNWDFTASNVYQSQFGYGLPSFDTSWTSTADNGSGISTYYQPSDGPQLFDLIAPTASAVPEPHSLVLLCFPVAIAVLTRWFQGARGVCWGRCERKKEGHTSRV
jgi:hypothetical protein